MPIEFTPDTDLFNVMAPLFGESDGFDGNGLDSEGYDRDGIDPVTGRDREGYDTNGYRPDAFDVDRDREGLDEGGYDADGYDAEGYNEEGWDRDDENRYGESRYEDDDYEDYEGRAPNFWQETPKYIFKSTTEEKQEAEVAGRYTQGKRLDRIPYFGMEIELTSDCNSGVKDIIHNQYEGLVWVKPDCSVEGFEMVTHPMTAAWAARYFPWGIVEELARAGCEVWRESNGLHIHVSRAGFNGFTHQLRWVKMFYSIQDQIAGRDGMAGREATEWGTFGGDHRKAQFDSIRDRMARTNGRRYEAKDYIPRYVALNMQNAQTIEARVFSATTNADTLRMRFELMASTVEYTRNQTIQDIRNGGWEYETYRSWLIKNEGRYPALERRVIPARTLA